MDSFACRTLRGPCAYVTLRGAETVIVGIQPDVAFALVRLGLSLTGVATALDLEDGIGLLDQHLQRGNKGGDESRVAIQQGGDIITARQQGRALAAHLGFSSADQTLIATAISEMARNILVYAKVGEIILRPEQNGKAGITIIAHDDGPGISDLNRALQNGYSTSGSLGVGLPGTKRIMDEFAIVSEVGKGTTVTMKKWKH